MAYCINVNDNVDLLAPGLPATSNWLKIEFEDDVFLGLKVKDSFFSRHLTFFSRVLRDSMTRYVCRSVCRSVGRSVRVSFFGVVGGFCVTAPAQNAWVSLFITAPAHPHATSVAVYPALLR